ncbi:hypothetical protein ACEQ8H_002903 [Pleosporales sp. CAS-2024a]
MQNLETANTTTTIQARRLQSSKLAIKVPGGLRMPIAPPSPFFDDMNTNTNTDVFPDFVDPYPPVKVESLHCVLHCQDSVCKHMVEYGIPVPPCRCGDEIEHKPPVVDTPPIKGPAILLDETILSALESAESDTNPNEMIFIRRDDVHTLLQQYEQIVVRRALADEAFMTALRESAPRRPEGAARDLVVSFLFRLLSLYFERTMRDVEIREVTPKQLRLELKVFLWSGMMDWVDRCCTEWEYDEIMDDCPETHMILEAACFGLPGLVSQLWQGCLDDVVHSFTWRHEQTRKYRAKQTVLKLGSKVLGALVIHAGVAAILTYL